MSTDSIEKKEEEVEVVNSEATIVNQEIDSSAQNTEEQESTDKIEDVGQDTTQSNEANNQAPASISEDAQVENVLLQESTNTNTEDHAKEQADPANKVDEHQEANQEESTQEESKQIELEEQQESNIGETREENPEDVQTEDNEESKVEQVKSESTEDKANFEISTTPDLVLSDDEINVDDISSSEDDSDSSSDEASDSDSDSDSDSEETDENILADEVDEEEEEEEDHIDGPIKSKHEVTEVAPVLPENYQIPENAPIEEIGIVTGLVENSMIIKARTSGEFRVLKEESIFCFDDRTVIGPLFEIFGRVQQPVYRVKFNSEEEFAKFKGTTGKSVYYVVPDSGFLYTDTIKHLKGTDASNCHDEELPPEEQEFSDDEAELAAKQAKKKKNKNKKPNDKRQGEPVVSASKRHQPVASYSPINNARSSVNRRENVHDYSNYSRAQPQAQPQHQPYVHTSTQQYQQPQQSQQSQYGQPYFPHADQQYRPSQQFNQYQGYQQSFQPPQPSFQQPLYPIYPQQQQFQQPMYQQQYHQEYQPAPANTNQVDPAQLEQLKQLLLQQIQQNQQNPSQ
ncbi:uncharacterized protein SPAPADRAFT_49317 [Spathaspora passalidarum NRRL Y-27907]|uniref:H/ACA ribonucleoprotein complex non-core subunit NAF1 n=1 Tax=Spathaspora passalidarum (strain NRRL Y-27907 / 11-Y1) TaxID=619300 RepID=G3AHU5_SPAPN|nr:uncharacterized protein SPAPADRAFT_49317 [Spathaspora passalidarum NRRL Y-27907]EGW34259.1 hypothetical protein SPAPADRAFT_49317 [Spathaspora passalidarum NRRL Y-27907]